MRSLKQKLVLLFCLFLTACISNPDGRIIHTTYNNKGEADHLYLSEYFEAKKTILDGALTIHLICTLGDERLPKGYKSNLNWTDRHIRDYIDYVDEIYLTNHSDKQIKINKLELNIANSFVKLIQKPIFIEPGTFIKSDPDIGSVFVYRKERLRTVKLNIDGKDIMIELMERRTPVKDLGKG